MNELWKDDILSHWKPDTSGNFVIRIITKNHKESRGVSLGNEQSEIHLHKQEGCISTSHTHTAFYRKV